MKRISGAKDSRASASSAELPKAETLVSRLQPLRATRDLQVDDRRDPSETSVHVVGLLAFLAALNNEDASSDGRSRLSRS